MKITIIGTGYVGLTTGTCFAHSGFDVTCVDIHREKIEQLKAGMLPIHEPGLEDIVAEQQARGRLKFTTRIGDSVRNADVVFLAVGTPAGANGEAELTQLFDAVDLIAFDLRTDAILVIKSTVPVGTNTRVFRRLQSMRQQPVAVVSNPEFLREGSAVSDCLNPDRIVIGTRRQETANLMRRLYDPQLRRETPFLVMSPESAEMAKYAANTMLAARISLINEIANICSCTGATISDVRRGIGYDRRIGFEFLEAGVGYGGSCFPKDVRALNHTAEAHGYQPLMLSAIDRVNERQKTVLVDRIIERFGEELGGLSFGVWGLTFKPGTDDIRESPSLTLIDELLLRGADVNVHDPVAMSHVEAAYGDRLTYAPNQIEAANRADALVIMTKWECYAETPPVALAMVMRTPVIFDGRNALNPDEIREAGLAYSAIGMSSTEVSLTVIPEFSPSGVENVCEYIADEPSSTITGALHPINVSIPAGHDLAGIGSYS